MKIVQLALPNKPNSNVNIGRALAFKCIQSDLKYPEDFENVGDDLEVGSALHADERGDLGLVRAGELRYIGHLLGNLNCHGGLIHADSDADVTDSQLVGHSYLNGDSIVT